MACLFPAHMIPNHAPLARLDLGRAPADLPSFAKLLAIHKNLTIVRHCDARRCLAFALRILSFAASLVGPFSFCTRRG